MNDESLKNKTILVLGGNPKEIIDGVRHYANHARPEDHGWQAAKKLAEQGARVILLTPKTRLPALPGVEMRQIKAGAEENATAADLAGAAENILAKEKVDAVFQLAGISSLRPAAISERKLKVKTSAGSEVPMDVTGNIDITSRLKTAAPSSTLLGFGTHQQLFEQGDASLLAALRPLLVPPPAQAPHAQATVSTIPGGKLAGKKIIVTSGPTVEPLTVNGDIITNFSSGDQGYAIASALARMGAKVELISGPTSLPAPTHPNLHITYTDSARHMRDEAVRHLPADAYVGVAAVADFGLEKPLLLRLGEGEPHTLMLSQNPDILQTMGNHVQRPAAVIGFAAENHDLLRYGSGKLIKKGADAICANPVDKQSRERIGKGNNEITWIVPARDLPESEIEAPGVTEVSAPGKYLRIDDTAAAQPWGVMAKTEVGARIGEKIASILLKKNKSSGACAQL